MSFALNKHYISFKYVNCIFFSKTNVKIEDENPKNIQHYTHFLNKSWNRELILIQDKIIFMMRIIIIDFGIDIRSIISLVLFFVEKLSVITNCST